MKRGALAVGFALLLVACGSSPPPPTGGATGGNGGGNQGTGGAVCNQIAPDGAIFSICKDASVDQGGKGGKGGDTGPTDAKYDLPPPPVGAE